LASAVATVRTLELAAMVTFPVALICVLPPTATAACELALITARFAPGRLMSCAAEEVRVEVAAMVMLLPAMVALVMLT